MRVKDISLDVADKYEHDLERVVLTALQTLQKNANVAAFTREMERGNLRAAAHALNVHMIAELLHA